ncbi:Myb-like DNA-binding domain containing protein [Tritrichomonas foetus]|uniref:Myb-like DNA-binding domain containing protein n=1 Tax=Tritrichomonas foetus TaxID=1144522 RepID=A0A1J4JIN2_9EUKA|nr:Myb-like DNA-binding domain containing protein [Tritrichomonas foetus]|eukprot:OHS98191.1 Myb-like DNA-binding domain containing protein [Tritrichomonas foetus]
MHRRQKKHVKFSDREDDKLKVLVEQEGPHKWTKIASKMPGRTAKQCRDRYQNYLSPYLINGAWTPEEDFKLHQAIRQYGKKWKQISQFFPKRSHNNVKNRYNSLKYMRSIEHMIEYPVDRYEHETQAPLENTIQKQEKANIKITQDIFDDDDSFWDSTLLDQLAAISKIGDECE